MKVETFTVRNKSSHSPTLDTQLMVEKCIRDASDFPSKRALMRALPRKVEYPTLVRILKYLEASDKIFIDENGAIVWVFVENPKLLKILEESQKLKSSDIQISQSITID